MKMNDIIAEVSGFRQNGVARPDQKVVRIHEGLWFPLKIGGHDHTCASPFRHVGLLFVAAGHSVNRAVS